MTSLWWHHISTKLQLLTDANATPVARLLHPQSQSHKMEQFRVQVYRDPARILYLRNVGASPRVLPLPILRGKSFCGNCHSPLRTCAVYQYLSSRLYYLIKDKNLLEDRGFGRSCWSPSLLHTSSPKSPSLSLLALNFERCLLLNSSGLSGRPLFRALIY